VHITTLWHIATCQWITVVKSVDQQKFIHPQSTHLSCSLGLLFDWCRLPDDHTRVRSKRPPTKLCHCQCRLGSSAADAWVIWAFVLFPSSSGEGVSCHSGIITVWPSTYTIKWPDYCRWYALFVELRSGTCMCICFGVSVNVVCASCPQYHTISVGHNIVK